MDLDKLALFVLVADMGSLTRAAVVRGMPQSVVSRQIGSFERQCGGPLFHRNGRGVQLTELGEETLPGARALIRHAEQFESEVAHSIGTPVGDVRLAVLPSTAQPLVIELLAVLKSRFPAIRLRVYEGSGGQIEEWLAKGLIDIALTFGKAKDSIWHAVPLGESSAHLIGWPGDPATRNDTVSFTQLSRLQFVLPGRPSGLRSQLDQIAKRRKFSLGIVMEADSLALQKSVVAEGHAHTILGFNAVAREVQEKRLQAARIVSPTIDRQVLLCTQPGGPSTRAIREVVQQIRSIMRKSPPMP